MRYTQHRDLAWVSSWVRLKYAATNLKNWPLGCGKLLAFLGSKPFYYLFRKNPCFRASKTGVFDRLSRRRVHTAAATMLRERLDDRIEAVGVFANQDIRFISDLYRNGIINLVQLHGDEDSDYIRRLRETFGCKGRGLPVIKAVSVENASPALPEGPDYLLFDTISDQRGGTGKTFDWSVLKDYKGPPRFLTVGLTAGNVANAVNLLALFCVDASSSVETNGIKNAEKISEFVRAERRIR